MSWAWLAILLGALIVGSRSSLIFDPKGTIELYQRITAALLGTDLRVRTLGVVYAAFAALCFAGGGASGHDPRSAGLVSILMVVGVLCVGAAIWTIAFPSRFRGTIEEIYAALARSPRGTRAIGVVALWFGAVLIVLGVQAL